MKRISSLESVYPYPEDGLGIASEVAYYALWAGAPTVKPTMEVGPLGTLLQTGTWSEEPQTPTAALPYHLKATLRTWTDGQIEVIGPEIIGTYGEKGDPGDDGNDGNGISSEVVWFAVTTTATAPSATIAEIRRIGTKTVYTIDSDDRTEWDTVAPPLTATNKYLWACRMVEYTQTTPTLVGPYIAGTYGEQGESGKVPYPAGTWDAGTTYTPTDRTTPYVERGGQYYILVKTTASKGEDPASSSYSDVWKHMDSFQYMLVNALVAQLARVGAAVFYDDFMMSQYGYHDNTGDLNYEPSEPATWEQLVRYALYGTEGCAKFVPQLLIDFKEGRLLAQNACIKGTVYATDGSFQGKVTAMEGSFTNGNISDCTMEDCKATRGTFEDVTVTGEITSSVQRRTIHVGNGTEYATPLNGSVVYGNEYVELPSLEENEFLEFLIVAPLITRSDTGVKLITNQLASGGGAVIYTSPNIAGGDTVNGYTNVGGTLDLGCGIFKVYGMNTYGTVRWFVQALEQV
jgi:hypothetical protein